MSGTSSAGEPCAHRDGLRVGHAGGFAESEWAQPTALRDYQKQGVKARVLPEPVLRELQKVTDEVLDEMAAKDEMFKRVLTSQREFMKHHRSGTAWATCRATSTSTTDGCAAARGHGDVPASYPVPRFRGPPCPSSPTLRCASARRAAVQPYFAAAGPPAGRHRPPAPGSGWRFCWWYWPTCSVASPSRAVPLRWKNCPGTCSAPP